MSEGMPSKSELPWSYRPAVIISALAVLAMSGALPAIWYVQPSPPVSRALHPVRLPVAAAGGLAAGLFLLSLLLAWAAASVLTQTIKERRVREIQWLRQQTSLRARVTGWQNGSHMRAIAVPRPIWIPAVRALLAGVALTGAVVVTCTVEHTIFGELRGGVFIAFWGWMAGTLGMPELVWVLRLPH